jgi:hypothetical protein
MDPDEVRMLVNTLLNVWEHTLAREDALRLVLSDCCRDWKHHYMKYVDDPGTIEHTKIVCAPLREVSEAVLQGSADIQLLERAAAKILKKPN